MISFRIRRARVFCDICESTSRFIDRYYPSQSLDFDIITAQRPHSSSDMFDMQLAYAGIRRNRNFTEGVIQLGDFEVHASMICTRLC